MTRISKHVCKFLHWPARQTPTRRWSRLRIEGMPWLSRQHWATVGRQRDCTSRSRSTSHQTVRQNQGRTSLLCTETRQCTMESGVVRRSDGTMATRCRVMAAAALTKMYEQNAQSRWTISAVRVSSSWCSQRKPLPRWRLALYPNTCRRRRASVVVKLKNQCACDFKVEQVRNLVRNKSGLLTNCCLWHFCV